MKKLNYFVLPLILLAAWAFITSLHIVDKIFLPTPWSVLQSLFSGLLAGQWWKDIVATIFRSLSGFVCAVIIGIPLGLLVGRISSLSNATEPTIDFFRSIPATTLFPLFLFLFGIGDKAKISIVIYGCSLIVLVNTAYGARQVKKSRILCAQVMGATRWHVFWKIIVPESAPGIFAGSRIALSLSFVLVIVSEMFIGTTVGLGYQVMNAQMVYRTSDMYAGIMLAGMIGYAANWSLLKLEKRVLHWVGH